ncbi:hypothetical protein P3G55_27050, partial [Leptospira sp. 96542]|nr:hypothetical protein [Leptospira sp. 96542]
MVLNPINPSKFLKKMPDNAMEQKTSFKSGLGAQVKGIGRGVALGALAVLRWIWRLLNGIQFRLAVFTGSLIAGTIVILSTSYVYQQTEILRE